MQNYVISHMIFYDFKYTDFKLIRKGKYGKWILFADRGISRQKRFIDSAN